MKEVKQENKINSDLLSIFRLPSDYRTKER
jgi:hypothetical protein